MSDRYAIALPGPADLPAIAPGTCPADALPAAPVKPLAALRAGLQPGGHLDILAVGSGSMLGPDAEHPADSFTLRMAQLLKRAAPDATIAVTLRGGRGVTVEQSLALIRSTLAVRHFDLVVWQTGTVEAIRGLPVSVLAATVRQGAEAIAAAGADLVLVDQQFSRALEKTRDVAPYEAALDGDADLPGVALFARFALMKAWIAKGGIDLERASPERRLATASILHDCLGRALARQLLRDAGLADAAGLQASGASRKGDL